MSVKGARDVISQEIRKMRSMSMKQIWDLAQSRDSKAREKNGLVNRSYMCFTEKCKNCSWRYCEHECHANETFIEPMDAEGNWLGLKKFAWVKR